ncbi:MAG: glycoside hydrolase family 97 protein [Melioribacteraceae bacterium]|nr:glycoside hydrolase family 97 protein [Melioribacteraceae bacterium]MCF8353244.1 glycoside hydrolase family 97 protein [Melioribacteraceae bacterium]MCF8393976.1 glycoside hydrolase family 97 protein [Melioribacteraceae bacterium]MCF8418722.1 glycoside hydrolase family 97 protein [Melioribacteraceae bacterium]
MKINSRINDLFSRVAIALLLIMLMIGCSKTDEVKMKSPDGNVEVEFLLKKDGSPNYLVMYKGSKIIDTSSLGFEFRDMPPIKDNLVIDNVEVSNISEIWQMVWGEQSEVENNYQEVKINLAEKNESDRLMNVIFKIYNDGIGFRYEFPEQKNMNDIVIMDENTQFKLTGDHKVWWIPGDWDIYEHLYKTTLLSELKVNVTDFDNQLAQTYIPYNAVNTPVTMKTDDGLYLSFHEANLTNYSGMTLLVDNEKFMLQSELVGSADESKVKITTPFVTPWRTIQIGEKAGDLIESKLIVNLNEPNKLEDISWIQPMKYTGIWWDMHVGRMSASWDYNSGNHAATTEYTKQMIDFAASNNLMGVLVEGWNTGWEDWTSAEREGIFDFVTPYPDYDLEEVVRYAKSKGVEMIMHHETSAAVTTYEQQLDTAYSLMKRLGIHAVKTGYVGTIIPKGEYHHGQFMVNHYRKVLLHAAEHQVMVNAHEPIKATGIRRTYPNAIAREGLRGQEFNAWSADGGNPPEHLTIVPFTRMLAGPIDFTPGIFDIKIKYRENNQVNTTIAHQLALYVVIYSPLQMAPDLIENYEGHPAFQFIRDVGIDWSETKVLNGEIGDYVTIVRKEKGTDNWFLGSVADENGKSMEIDLSFLDADKKYNATIYKDADDAHWNDNPTAYVIENKVLTSEDKLSLNLVPGGGCAVSFFPVK